MSDKAIEDWKSPYSSEAYHMASAIMQRYRTLQESEAGVSEYAALDDMARIRRDLHDEWFYDVKNICDGMLKHLTDTIEYQQKLLTDRINVQPAPLVIGRLPAAPCFCWWCRFKEWLVRFSGEAT